MTDSIEAMTPHVDQQELAEQLVAFKTSAWWSATG